VIKVVNWSLGLKRSGEVRKVEAPNRGWQGECSVVARVRRLLEDFGCEERKPDARTRLTAARDLGTARVDLEEIESRVRRLRSFRPDIAGVEVGPMVHSMRDFFVNGSRRRKSDGDGFTFSRGMSD